MSGGDTGLGSFPHLRSTDISYTLNFLPVDDKGIHRGRAHPNNQEIAWVAIAETSGDSIGLSPPRWGQCAGGQAESHAPEGVRPPPVPFSWDCLVSHLPNWLVTQPLSPQTSR